MKSGTEYGKALFELCEESSSTERTLGDISAINRLLRDNPEYQKLLDTPAVPKEERVALAEEAFGSFDSYLVNLIKILCERRSAYLFPKIAEEFFALYDESRGIERAEAVSAVALTEEQTARIISKLEAITGKRIVLKNTVDQKILGGLKLRFSGRQLDGSVKTKLESFEKSLKSTVV